MIPAIAIISCLSCDQGTRGSFKYFPKNTLPQASSWRNMKSAVHVPYAGWLTRTLSCSVLARTHDFKKFCHQSKYSAVRPSTMLWYNASYRWLCVRSSMSSPLHHLSYRCQNVLICLQAPISFSLWFCTSFTAAFLRIAPRTLCRMLILVSYFPCLAARVFPREDCSIRPLAPLFAYIWIWNSLIRHFVGSLIRCLSSVRFHSDQESCCSRCNSVL